MVVSGVRVSTRGTNGKGSIRRVTIRSFSEPIEPKEGSAPFKVSLSPRPEAMRPQKPEHEIQVNDSRLKSIAAVPVWANRFDATGS